MPKQQSADDFGKRFENMFRNTPAHRCQCCGKPFLSSTGDVAKLPGGRVLYAYCGLCRPGSASKKD